MTTSPATEQTNSEPDKQPTTAEVTYTFIVLDTQKGSLEHRAYENIFHRHLSALNLNGTTLRKVDSTSTADYIASFYYNISDGRTQVNSVPIFGQTGGGTTHTFGNIYGRGGFTNFSATTNQQPTFGIVGTNTYTSTYYTALLSFDVFEANSVRAGNPIKIYDAKLTTSLTSPNLTEVMPYMIAGLFRDFPGESGKSKNIFIRTRDLYPIESNQLSSKTNSETTSTSN